MRKALIIVSLLLLVVVSSVGIYSFVFNKNKTTLTKENSEATVLPNTNVVTGEVLVLSITDKTVIVQFIAESTKGNITQMMVWTDNNPTKEWQKFSTLITLPISDNVYAKYRDDINNESQVYTDSIFPKYSPPSQP